MTRVFLTASGIKKTASEAVFKIKNIAVIIFSENSLKTALNIYKGIAEEMSGKKESDISEIINFTFFIQGTETPPDIKDINAITGINAHAESYEKLSVNFLKRLFEEFDFIVFFLALGAVVRLIAPFIKDKFSDPGVIAIDEAGKFVVSVLSGHIGGANKFAEDISRYMGAGAIPVITTATDATESFSIDIFAEKFGFFIEDREDKIKIFNKASLKGEKFIIFIEDGVQREAVSSYICKFSNAKNFSFLNSPNILKLNGPKIIAVSIKDDLKKVFQAANTAVLRPRRLVAGIGCNKNTGFKEIEDFILSEFARNNISINALRNIATIDLKEKEECILRFGEKYAQFIDFFTKEEINGFTIKKNEKSLCFKYTGAYSVCEPCASLSAKNKTSPLLIPKQKKGGATLAVAAAD